MKRRNKLLKLTGVLLCLVMLCGIGAMSVSAVSYILGVEVTGLTAPQEDMEPDYDLQVPSNDYVVDYVEWFNHKTGMNMEAGERFKASQDYQLIIYLYSDTYNFKFDFSGKPILDDKIVHYNNGDTVQESVFAYGDSDVPQELILKVDFTIPETKRITDVPITGVVAPVTGAKPSTNAVAAGVGFKIDDECGGLPVNWYPVMENGYPGSQMSPEDTFEHGKKYQVEIYLRVTDDYKFKVDDPTDSLMELTINPTINGEAAEDYTGYGQDIIAIIGAVFTCHDAPVLTGAKEATCIENGYTGDEICETCKFVYEKGEDISKSAHDSNVTIPAVAATCTKTGLTEGKKCSVCGTVTVEQTEVAKKAHTEVKLSAVAPTCTKTGKTAGKKCSVCGTVTVAQKIIAKLGHTYKTTTTKATLKANGKTVTKCTVCGNVSKTTTINYPKTITLSKTDFTYNGKVQKPTVTVKDSKGKALKNGTDYSVTYEKGCKATGKYTVTITFKGKYSGTKELDFTIAPKATSKITAVTSTSAIKLTWNKVTGATGYRVYQYNAKTKKWVSIKTLTGTSYKVQKLTAGTKYKFRVKAYKTDGGTIWGADSKTFETVTKCTTPTLKAVSATKGVAILAWTNVSGESGYQVYYSTNKDSGCKALTTTKANVASFKKSNLTSKKTYYFKVRAYTKTASGNVYSAWSSVKSVKVK